MNGYLKTIEQYFSSLPRDIALLLQLSANLKNIV